VSESPVASGRPFRYGALNAEHFGTAASHRRTPAPDRP